MALLIERQTFANSWWALLNELTFIGKIVSPRGQETKEILNVCFHVRDGLNNILLSEFRGLNYRFMIAEWLWIYGAFEDVETLAKYNSIMKNFSDDGQILSGAYGPRLFTQWDYILSSLRKPDSRQAVATIWTPSPKDSKDIPCTISVQWLIREGKIHTTVNMRSSDIWLGLPYDFFNFSQLTNALASKLDVEVGSVTFNLGSSHLYSKDYNTAKEVISEGDYDSLASPPIETNIDQKQAKAILNQDLSVELPELFSSYRLALENNKIHALEVLRELAPK
ncbi:MAG TPA: thymidylate synthase [Candidatus Saccharimonadales bacterium]|jgi:thymidylate synthase